jgi:NADH dehydrogenase (ubiquinone) 1 subunit C2
MGKEDLHVDGPKLDPTCYLFLEGDNARKTTSALSHWWLPMAMPTLGVVASLYSNSANKIPYRAKMHKHIIFGVCGLALGLYTRKIKAEWLAEKDVLYYHYMTLHPEDFPPPEKIKFRDYLSTWTPVR